MVRYGEGPSVEVQTVVAAPPEAVWALVADPPLLPRFSDELREVSWLDQTVGPAAGGPAAGARFEGRNSHPKGGTWTTTSTVVVCDPPHRFEWAVGDPDGPSATWGFLLEPVAGGTRLTQWGRMGPGASGLTPAIEAMPDKELRIVERRLQEHEANMTRTVEGIRILAETGRGT